MNHIKLYEEFITAGNSEEASAESEFKKSHQFLYYIIKDGQKEFHGEVKDQDGKVIVTLSNKAFHNGVMTNSRDISNLRNWLIKRKKIGQDDEVIPAEGTDLEKTSGEFVTPNQVKAT